MKHRDVVNPNTGNSELPASINMSHASESESESHPTLYSSMRYIRSFFGRANRQGIR